MTKKTTTVPDAIVPPAAHTFTRQEAQALINVARAAPVANLDAADRVRTLLERFARWYDSLQTK